MPFVESSTYFCRKLQHYFGVTKCPWKVLNFTLHIIYTYSIHLQQKVRHLAESLNQAVLCCTCICVLTHVLSNIYCVINKRHLHQYSPDGSAAPANGRAPNTTGADTGRSLQVDRPCKHFSSNLMINHYAQPVKSLHWLMDIMKKRSEEQTHKHLHPPTHPVPGAVSGIVRMNPLCFQAGCRTRRVNQA